MLHTYFFIRYPSTLHSSPPPVLPQCNITSHRNPNARTVDSHSVIPSFQSTRILQTHISDVSTLPSSGLAWRHSNVKNATFARHTPLAVQQFQQIHLPSFTHFSSSHHTTPAPPTQFSVHSHAVSSHSHSHSTFTTVYSPSFNQQTTVDTSYLKLHLALLSPLLLRKYLHADRHDNTLLPNNEHNIVHRRQFDRPYGQFQGAAEMVTGYFVPQNEVKCLLLTLSKCSVFLNNF